MDLIDSLKSEHQQILSLFDQIDQTTDINVIHQLVKQLEIITSKHLQEEDDSLYPSFAQSKSQETKQIGTVFSNTMPEYVADFTKVTATILNTDTITPEILSQYQKIRDKIKNRIIVEENILFPSFNK
ncbi:MAG: hemerythrin domain-containing protein [Candidatus Shapirobacteria bacterium]